MFAEHEIKIINGFCEMIRNMRSETYYVSSKNLVHEKQAYKARNMNTGGKISKKNPEKTISIKKSSDQLLKMVKTGMKIF